MLCYFSLKLLKILFHYKSSVLSFPNVYNLEESFMHKQQNHYDKAILINYTKHRNFYLQTVRTILN